MRDHAEGRSQSHTVVERLLVAIGANRELTDGILGDLAEEFSSRAERHGAAAARAWYAYEALRCAPHLVRNALHHGSPATRVRLGGALAACALALTLAVVALYARKGPPASIVADNGDNGAAIVVNNTHPAQLAMRVLDKRGRLLKVDSLRFQRVAGAPIAVSPTGVVTCTREGDVMVRASVASITTNVDVLCRPVQEVRGTAWINFVQGDTARPMPFVAIGLDGEPVTELRGAATIRDTTIAAVRGPTIYPRAVGSTIVTVDVGDKSMDMRVVVHEKVASFAVLRRDQRFVAMPVKVAQGDTLRWSLPGGVFWLKYFTARPGEPPPTITVEGGISCSAGNGLRVYRVALDEYSAYCFVQPNANATVVVAHGKVGANVVHGALALEQVY